MYNSPFKNKDIDNINRVEPGNTSNAMINQGPGDPPEKTGTATTVIVGKRRSSTTEDLEDGYTVKNTEVRRKDGTLKMKKSVTKGPGERSVVKGTYSEDAITPSRDERIKLKTLNRVKGVGKDVRVSKKKKDGTYSVRRKVK